MIKKFITTSLWTFVTLAAMVSFLVTTEMGLNISLHLAKAIIPGTLQVKELHGRISDGFVAEGIFYKNNHVLIKTQHIAIHWRLSELFKKQIHLSLQWQHFLGDFSDKIKLHSDQGKLQITGGFANYQLYLHGDIPLPHKTSTKLLVDGHGNKDSLIISKLELPIFKGKVIGNGRLGWKDGWSWNANLHSEHLQENNLLVLHGGYDKRWQLAWKLHIPDLSKLFFGSKGSINSEGTIHGATSHPTINGTLNIDNFAQENIHIESFTAKINSSITLRAKEIHWGDFALDAAAVAMDGNWKQHTIRLNLENHDAKIQQTIIGRLHNYEWHGALQSFTLNTTHYGNWHAAKNTVLIATKEKIIAKPVCLISGRQKLCADFNWRNISGGNLTLVAKHISTELLRTHLPKNTDINSQFNGDLHLHITNQLYTTGKAKFTLQAGSIAYPVNGQIKTLGFDAATLTGKIDQSGATTTLFLSAENQQHIHVNLHLPQYHHLRKVHAQQRLVGKATVAMNDIGLLGLFLPQLNDIQGTANLNLEIRGTVGKPITSGRLRLENASAKIQPLHINLENIELNALGNQTGAIHFEGEATSDKGKLKLVGDSLLSQPGHPTKLQITGENFLAFNTDEYKIYASPNIKLKTHGKNIVLQGKLDIPKANIAPQDFTGTVELSNDIVFVEHKKKPTKSSPWKLTSDLELNLGDNVEVKLKGLHGKFAGHVKLHDEPGRLTTASGELKIIDGEYQAYGKVLKIREGHLIYATAPVDNPNLNIMAERVIPIVDPSKTSSSNKITVGAKVSGALSAPKINLYSEPANLRQADILSYLILGHPLEDLSKDKADNKARLSDALNLLSLNGDEVAQINQQIQQKLGLDAISIEKKIYTDENNNKIPETSLVLGKALSPQLYVNYSVGLLSHFNILNVRYLIGKHWSLQTQTQTSGMQNTGIDILYTTDKG